MSLPRIAITLGDPAGIGPEVALKAALDPRVRAVCRPLLVGDPVALEWHAKACGLALLIRCYRSAADADGSDDGVDLLAIDRFSRDKLDIGRIAAAHGLASIEATRAAIEAALEGEVDAVVAAPMTETAIKAAGIEFDGYPSFLARAAGVPEEDVFLMHCFDDKRILHVTLHVSLRRMLELVTRERVGRAVRAADDTLRRIGIAAPRIAVAGLNPHASENGMFGDDEARIIGPAIDDAKRAGIRAEGPFGADTMFLRPGYDAFVVMYHDQGHIASKLLAPNRVAGLAVGTKVLFSSVAHGSGLDIAGQNRASPEAMIEAVRRLAGAMAQAPVA